MTKNGYCNAGLSVKPRNGKMKREYGKTLTVSSFIIKGYGKVIKEFGKTIKGYGKTVNESGKVKKGDGKIIKEYGKTVREDGNPKKKSPSSPIKLQSITDC